MRWSKNKFDHKVLEKVLTKLAIKQVVLSNLTTQLEWILKVIHFFYIKLFDLEFFTLENQRSIELIHADIKACTISLRKNTSSNSPTYNKLTLDQQRFVELLTRDGCIRNKNNFNSIHATTPFGDNSKGITCGLESYKERSPYFNNREPNWSSFSARDSHSSHGISKR